ncbi:MAG TPA: hypothetical protein VHW01_08255 [Polyangiaceae bacterium]|jgi:hypothetical protein|nr:hypothetical protein [Polyangiaceae bacterium]
MPLRPPPATEQMREAIRDLTGILRAMYAAADPHRRAGIVAAGLRLAELDAVVAQESTAAYELAPRAADSTAEQTFPGCDPSKCPNPLFIEPRSISLPSALGSCRARYQATEGRHRERCRPKWRGRAPGKSLQ